MKKTKKCHYISQVYLRQWRKNNKVDNLNIYDKNSKEIINNGFSIKNNFYINNLYNITFSETLTYLNQFPLMKTDFQSQIKKFEEENNVKTYYNKEPFNINKDNLGCLIDKNNVDFKKENGFVPEKIKNNLYNAMSQLKSTIIEDALCNQIENKWNDLLERINKASKFKRICLKDDEMQTLRDMTVTMALRIKETPGFPELSSEVKKISEWAKIFFTKMFATDKAGEAAYHFPELFFKKSNYSELFEKENSHLRNVLFKENILNYELYVINEKDNLEFHTSDVPCFKHISNYEVDNRNNAIYFPIAPKMLLVLKKDTELKNIINILEVDINKIKYLNNLIYNHAVRYIIFKNKWEDK